MASASYFPIKVSIIGNKLVQDHTEYMITTSYQRPSTQQQGNSNSSSSSLAEFTVSRRYREFEDLHNTLSSGKFTDIRIPTLPEKKFWGNKSADFVKKRERELDRYLMSVLDSLYTYSTLPTMSREKLVILWQTMFLFLGVSTFEYTQILPYLLSAKDATRHGREIQSPGTGSTSAGFSQAGQVSNSLSNNNASSIISSSAGNENQANQNDNKDQGGNTATGISVVGATNTSLSPKTLPVSADAINDAPLMPTAIQQNPNPIENDATAKENQRMEKIVEQFERGIISLSTNTEERIRAWNDGSNEQQFPVDPVILKEISQRVNEACSQLSKIKDQNGKQSNEDGDESDGQNTSRSNTNDELEKQEDEIKNRLAVYCASILSNFD